MGHAIRGSSKTISRYILGGETNRREVTNNRKEKAKKLGRMALNMKEASKTAKKTGKENSFGQMGTAASFGLDWFLGQFTRAKY